MISNSQTDSLEVRHLRRAFLECVLGHYVTPELYPLWAAEAVASGVETPSLVELAGLSRNASGSEIADLMVTIGQELGWGFEPRALALRRLFALWACDVGGEIAAVDFAARSRLAEVRQLPPTEFAFFAPLVALDIEWEEENRPRDVVERDIAILAEALCSR